MKYLPTLLAAALAISMSILAHKAGVAKGAASVQVKDCTPEVNAAYSHGVAVTVRAAQKFIVGSCQEGEITADGETFVCMKKQEM